MIDASRHVPYHYSMSDPVKWLTVSEAAAILRMTPRQVNRYGNTGRIRTQRAGRRVLYHNIDVEQLADELRVDERPHAQPSSLAAPLASLADQLRDRDHQLAESQRRLEERLERIEAQQRQLPSGDREELRQLLTEVIAEREAIRQKEQPGMSRIAVGGANTVFLFILLIILALLIYIVLTR
jgi:hypothetical protein